MKTVDFVGKLEEMGYETLNAWLKTTGNDLKDEYVEVIYIHKDDENRVHVGLTRKWLIKNDYFGFAALSDAEKDALMELVIEFTSTEPEERN